MSIVFSTLSRINDTLEDMFDYILSELNFHLFHILFLDFDKHIYDRKGGAGKFSEM